MVSKSLKKLKPRDADMLYLYFYFELTQREIAEIFKLSPRRVHEIIWNSKKNLKKIVDKGSKVQDSTLLGSTAGATL